MFRAVGKMPCYVYDCIFSWSTIEIKAFERKREKKLLKKREHEKIRFAT